MTTAVFVVKNMVDKGIISVALFLSLLLNFTPFLRASDQENVHKKIDKKNASCVQPEMIEIIKDGMSAIYQMKDGKKYCHRSAFKPSKKIPYE